jgi:hypothetical protein
LPQADGPLIGRQWIGNALPVIIKIVFISGEISPILALYGIGTKRKEKKEERKKEGMSQGCIHWVIARVAEEIS